MKLSKRGTLLIILGLFLFVSGCETARGFANGLSRDIKNTWENLKGLDEKLDEEWW